MKSEFEKSQSERILACYGIDEDILKGGKPAFIGERRTHTDQSEWEKTSYGWQRVKEVRSNSSSSDETTNNQKVATKTDQEHPFIPKQDQHTEQKQERQDDKKQDTKPKPNQNDPAKNAEAAKKMEEQHKQQQPAGEKPKEDVAADGKEEPKSEKTKGKKSLTKSGINTLKEFELLRLNAYKDDAGHWTIGYGSRFWKDGTEVKKGDKLKDKQEASDLFDYTLTSYADAVNKKVKVPITQNQFDALVLFTYNAGPSSGKTLFEKLNKEDYTGAAAEFDKWTKITDPKTKKKVVAAGLKTRRAKEKKLFLKGN